MPCLKVDPSTFTKRVTLQAEALTPDGQGGVTSAWNAVATVWAAVEPLKEWERMQAQQLQSPVTHKVTMRYHPQATAAKRLLYKGRAFDVKGVVNLDEDDAFLELRCVET